jgi:BASS family bile acid:Na+ symporter
MFLKLFPVWAPCAAFLGYFFSTELSTSGSAIVPLLTTVMLCMGLTLKPKDFNAVFKYRYAILIGMALQFSVMPFMALLIASILQLGPELTTGLVLVGTVAGGTSSNVMTYIANGDVALSVAMTALSTLISVLMTPLLMTALVGTTVVVPVVDMLLSLLKLILLPVISGVVINYWFSQAVQRIESALAPISVIAILIIIAIVVALNADNMNKVAFAVVLATLAHNLSGLVFGYLGTYLLGFDKKICRTIAIEVGMQNSGLATALALKFFSPLTALPGAIFSVWLNITGSVFASICVRFDRSRKKSQLQED